MRTMYYKTSNFIQHTGNLVDLNEFRRRTAVTCEDGLPQRDSLARQPETACEPKETREEPAFRPVVLTMTRAQLRRAGWERRSWTLDVCASLAVVFMTLLFTLRVLL